LIDIVEIITGKKFARPAIDVDESSGDGGGKPPAKKQTHEKDKTPEHQVSLHCLARKNGK